MAHSRSFSAGAGSPPNLRSKLERSNLSIQAMSARSSRARARASSKSVCQCSSSRRCSSRRLRMGPLKPSIASWSDAQISPSRRRRSNSESLTVMAPPIGAGFPNSRLMASRWAGAGSVRVMRPSRESPRWSFRRSRSTSHCSSGLPSVAFNRSASIRSPPIKDFLVSIPHPAREADRVDTGPRRKLIDRDPAEG